MEADTFMIIQQRVPHLLSNWVVKQAFLITYSFHREKKFGLME